MKTYIILGDPVPLSRPRMSFKNKRVFDTQKNLKLVVGIDLANQHDNDPIIEDPVHLDVIFFMPTPKTNTKNLSGKYHYYTPDLDNLIKMVCDFSQGIIIKNDAIVSSITSRKIYDQKPRTEFTFTVLKGSNEKHKQ